FPLARQNSPAPRLACGNQSATGGSFFSGAGRWFMGVLKAFCVTFKVWPPVQPIGRMTMASAVAALAFGLLTVQQTDGAFISPSWTRPTTTTQATTDSTTYQRYDVFTSATGPNTADVANLNPSGSANVYDTSGMSFLTSGGNIYSFSAPTFIEAIVPNYGLG